MTKVVFFKSKDVFWGFEEQGHAGFAEQGEDIVCSALSRGLSRVVAGKSRFPRLLPGTLGNFPGCL